MRTMSVEKAAGSKLLQDFERINVREPLSRERMSTQSNRSLTIPIANAFLLASASHQ